MTRAVVVSAPATGCGKTTVALGLMAAFRTRGMAVQPFKVGPDYIDTAYHTRVCGRPSVNLDPWMTSEAFVRGTFHRHRVGADIAIVEGVMGLFDSAGQGGELGSTAHVAKLLGVPVLLVVDGYTAAESLAAQALGCEDYDPEVRIIGVLVNRSAGGSHLSAARGAITSACAAPLLGALPDIPAMTMPERQLGLTSVLEHPLTDSDLDRLADLMDQHVELDALLDRLSRVGVQRETPRPAAPNTQARIGIARDRAFCFYYEDNLRLLRQAGADLVSFSPLDGDRLPDGVAGLYLGGGFPEEFAPQLAANAPMLESLRNFSGPIFAECGGLIYLCESFMDRDGREHAMAGRVPGIIEMTDALQGFGYVEAETASDTLFGDAGTIVRGHEFHWSRWKRRPEHGWGAFRTMDGAFGYADATTLASYLHVHFGGRPAVAEAFARACAAAASR